MLKYFMSGLSATMFSWLIGLIFIALAGKTAFYKRWSNWNFITSDRLNKVIGIGIFKWIVKNTFFKYLNQKLQLTSKIEITQLKQLRDDMTAAEISHLVGFAFVSVFALIKVVNGNYLFALAIMIVNIILNFYPALLQQENKRRIDRFLRKHN